MYTLSKTNVRVIVYSDFPRVRMSNICCEHRMQNLTRFIDKCQLLEIFIIRLSYVENFGEF